MRRRERALILLTTGVLALASLTGCAETAAEATGPLTIPPCDDLLTQGELDAMLLPGAEGSTLGAEFDLANDYMPTDSGKTAIRSADSSVGCWWGEPYTDGGVVVVIAELNADVRDELAASLADDELFTELPPAGTARLFHGEPPVGFGWGYTHVLVDRLFVTVQGGGAEGNRPLALAVIDHIREANPDVSALAGVED